MIRVHHFKVDSPDKSTNVVLDVMLRTVNPQSHAARVATIWTTRRDLYEPVCEVNSDDLEMAWRLTNNVDSSWSLQPDNKVKVTACRVTESGAPCGVRSSMVGDVFELDGVPHVVSTAGFTPLPYVEPGGG